MPPQVLKRLDWFGTPETMADVFVVRKNGREAICRMYSHELGWELRLFVDNTENILMTHVCRTQDEWFATWEGWQEALEGKGWA